MIAKRDKALAEDAEGKVAAEAKGQVYSDIFDLKSWKAQVGRLCRCENSRLT